MAYTNVIDACTDAAFLDGRSILACATEYSSTSFKLDNGDVVTFGAEEVAVGKWFEVFPLRRATLDQAYPFVWTTLAQPFAVSGAVQLWREEWQEPAPSDAACVGAGPNRVQCAGPLGSVPASDDPLFKVHAGILLLGPGEARIAVCTSASSPFLTELALAGPDIARILLEHTPA